MRRFTSGLIAGGLLGAVAVSCAMNDRRARKRVMRSGRMMRSATESVMNTIMDMF